jgi:hypothetical protein
VSRIAHRIVEVTAFAPAKYRMEESCEYLRHWNYKLRPGCLASECVE